ncbi:adenylate kinase isoenzyme 1 isoform 2-T2 [Chlamydotis macqueenii]
MGCCKPPIGSPPKKKPPAGSWGNAGGDPGDTGQPKLVSGCQAAPWARGCGQGRRKPVTSPGVTRHGEALTAAGWGGWLPGASLKSSCAWTAAACRQKNSNTTKSSSWWVAPARGRGPSVRRSCRNTATPTSPRGTCCGRRSARARSGARSCRPSWRKASWCPWTRCWTCCGTPCWPKRTCPRASSSMATPVR